MKKILKKIKNISIKSMIVVVVVFSALCVGSVKPMNNGQLTSHDIKIFKLKMAEKEKREELAKKNNNGKSWGSSIYGALWKNRSNAGKVVIVSGVLVCVAGIWYALDAKSFSKLILEPVKSSGKWLINKVSFGKYFAKKQIVPVPKNGIVYDPKFCKGKTKFFKELNSHLLGDEQYRCMGADYTKGNDGGNISFTIIDQMGKPYVIESLKCEVGAASKYDCNPILSNQIGALSLYSK